VCLGSKNRSRCPSGPTRFLSHNLLRLVLPSPHTCTRFGRCFFETTNRRRIISVYASLGPSFKHVFIYIYIISCVFLRRGNDVFYPLRDCDRDGTLLLMLTHGALDSGRGRHRNRRRPLRSFKSRSIIVDGRVARNVTRRRSSAHLAYDFGRPKNHVFRGQPRRTTKKKTP